MARESPAGVQPTRERPILFQDRLVQAILEDRKGQTRRLARFKPYAGSGFNPKFSGLEAGHYSTGMPASGWVLRSRGAGGCWNDRTEPLHCPYGMPGDRLWVREAWASWVDTESRPCIVYRAGGAPRAVFYDHGGEGEPIGLGGEVVPATAIPRWRPSIFMPRWASRLALEVAGEVRVQRLQAITEEEAQAEGVPRDGRWWLGALHSVKSTPKVYPTAREAFASGWDSINGHRPGASWEDNPWVWAVTFKRADDARRAA